MKRIENLNVRSVRTQGIVRDDGTIPISTVSFRPADYHQIAPDGFRLSKSSSFRSTCCPKSFAASSPKHYALHKSQTFLGEFFRRMKARLGPAKAITAVAHKLARILYHMITHQQEYDVTLFKEQERRSQERKRLRLNAQAREFGLRLVPTELFLRRAPDSASPVGDHSD
jgi:hypothetical protein